MSRGSCQFNYIIAKVCGCMRALSEPETSTVAPLYVVYMKEQYDLLSLLYQSKWRTNFSTTLEAQSLGRVEWILKESPLLWKLEINIGWKRRKLSIKIVPDRRKEIKKNKKSLSESWYMPPRTWKKQSWRENIYSPSILPRSSPQPC